MSTRTRLVACGLAAVLAALAGSGADADAAPRHCKGPLKAVATLADRHEALDHAWELWEMKTRRYGTRFDTPGYSLERCRSVFFGDDRWWRCTVSAWACKRS